MDPVTTAIVAALPELAVDGIKSAYEGLKAMIQHKWGEGAPITKAVAALEEDPSSKAQAAVLEEKVGSIKAAQDADVAQALHRLVEEMKAHGVGGKAVASIQVNISGGTQTGIIGAQNVSAGTMTFGKT